MTEADHLRWIWRIAAIAAILVILTVLGAVEAGAAAWTAAGSLTNARMQHTATLLPSGKVLVAGGTGPGGFLAGAELYDPAAGTWTATGSLNAARMQHTATLLPSGKVLVAGGAGPGGYLAGAELYDPALGTWTATGNLTAARRLHTATLLPSGKVLVAGGAGPGSFLAGAELYDPATGVWTNTGNLAAARCHHTATLLPDGKVLVAGGWDGFSALATAEIYDPATGSWSATGSLTAARLCHTATLLPSGKVLVAGGDNSGGCLAGAELFDPATGAWSSTGSLNAAREYHTATLLPDGKVLVAGGWDGFSALATAEIYDPATGSWSATGSLTAAREYHTATLLPSGKVLVAGGLSGGYPAGAELYDPGAGAWTNTGSLTAAREYHTATLLANGKVLVAGGYNGGYLASAELYDPAAGVWTATGSLNAARSYHTATLLPSGKVLVAGGGGGSYLASAELYDPATGVWTATGSLATTRIRHTATLLPSGKVLVAGGRSAGGFLAGTELYDPATGAWTATGSLATVRIWHTATLLPSGKVLVAGGNNGGYLASAELYDPAAGAWTAIGGLNTARDSHTATLLPSGKVLIAGGTNGGWLASAELFNPAAQTWTIIGSLSTARGYHTATLLPSGKVLVAGGLSSSGYQAGAELFDPAAGAWTAIGSLNTARLYHTATLLPSGNVLVAGGYNGGYLTGAELFDRGLGYLDAWRPTVTMLTSPLVPGAALQITGTGFRGYGTTEASGGAGNNSATNYPLVQLSWMDSGQAQWLSPDPSQPFSATSFTSRAVTGFPAGPTLVTVFVSGIPSESRAIVIGAPPAITSANSATFTVGSAGTFIVTGTGSPTPALSKTGALPGGVTFIDNGNGTATLAGTPASGTNGVYPIVITAGNGIPPNATQNFTLTVTSAPFITSANSATFTIGSAGTFTVTGTGSPAPALSKTGALPAGVTFIDNGNATATLAGTPAAGTNGVYPVVITAANGLLPDATQNFTLTVTEDPNADSDYDSVRDPEERGPDGNNPDYDGNRDNIPDWRQSNVASFFAFDQERGRHYLTLAVSSGGRIESLFVQRAFDAPPPAGVSFPYGFFSFTLAGVAKGGAATATIYLDGTPPQTYYKYGKAPDMPVDHWYEFAYDGETGAEVVGNTVVLHFIDGKRGDDDLEANGKITDPGGPAEIAPHAGLYFPYLVSTSDEKTEIGIINTKSYASQSTISYYGANGDLLRTAAITLGPYGKATISSAGIPPGSASAIVSEDGAPVGYTRYASGAGKRCAWPAATSLQKTFSVPHTAVNAEWATALGLFNPNDTAVEVTLVYESGGSSKLTLNPKASTFIQLTAVESVISIISTGYISAMEMFDSLLPGGDRAALLLKERSLDALYVPSILSGPGAFTGIGLNSYYHGLLHVRGHSATGAVEELSFGTQPLGSEGPRSRIAFVLSGMLGEEDLWAKISGEADFTTPVGKPLLHFQGLAVYGKDNTRKLGALNLNALRFREGFIGILSAAEETTLTLLNPNTAEATLTATGYNAAGEALAGNTIKVGAGSRWTGTATDLVNGASAAEMTHIRMVSDGDLSGFETISTDGRIEMLPVMGME